MSSQGSGSLGEDFVYETFLSAWGSWAREGAGGPSIRPGAQFLFPQEDSRLSWVFTDDEMLLIDATVSQLSQESRQILKRVYVRDRPPKSRGDLAVFAAAYREFADQIREAEGDGRIAIHFLSKTR